MLTPLLASQRIAPLLSASPALAPTLPASLLAQAAPGTVDAPIWVLPVAAAACGLIPVLLLAMTKGSTTVNSNLKPTAVGGGPDPVLAWATRHPKLRRRLRRERLLFARRVVAVLDTERKGRGLFAMRSLPKGTYLFDYEGESLDLPSYQQRYSDGVSDYAVGIKMSDGRMRFVDAADPLKSGLARFMNHDVGRCANVARKTKFDDPSGPRVIMYTTRNVEAGEELQWDYGPGYIQAHGGMVSDSTVRTPQARSR